MNLNRHKIVAFSMTLILVALVSACSVTSQEDVQEITSPQASVSPTREEDAFPDGVALLPNAGSVGVDGVLKMELYDHLFYFTKHPNVSIQWSTSDPAIATIDSNGQVTGHKPGITKVMTTVIEEDGSAYSFTSTLEVGEPVTELLVAADDRITIDTISIPCYCSQTLYAATLDSASRNLDNRRFIWEVDMPEVLTIETAEKIDDSFLLRPYETPSILSKLDRQFFYQEAILTGLHAGTAMLIITSEGISKNIRVNVDENELVTLQITPATITLTEKQSRLAAAVGFTAENCRADDVAVSWQIEDPNIAIVDPVSGNVTGVNAGKTTLIASYQEKTATAEVVVSPAD